MFVSGFVVTGYSSAAQDHEGSGLLKKFQTPQAGVIGTKIRYVPEGAPLVKDRFPAVLGLHVCEGVGASRSDTC